MTIVPRRPFHNRAASPIPLASGAEPKWVRRAFLACAVLAVAASSWSWLSALGGDLDPSFGTGGIVRTDVPAVCCEDGSSIAVQPDGKIVIAGTVFDPADNTVADYDFALVRYDADGSLDTTFGGGDGIVVTKFAAKSLDSISGLVIQSDGKIVVVGNTTVGGVTQFAVARYQLDGSLDPNFSGDGKATVVLPFNSGEANAIALQDGKIVVAGWAGDGDFQKDFALARLNGDGTLDTAFGNSGLVFTPIATGNPNTPDFDIIDDVAEAVIVQPDGWIVAAGYTWDPDTLETDMVAVRHSPDGKSLDAGFGTNGIVRWNHYTRSALVTDLALQPDGRIVAAGYARNPNGGLVWEFALARFNPDGSFDPTFDGDGKVTTRFQPLHPEGVLDAQGEAVAIQADGRIVVVGRQGNDIGIARYQANGAPDVSFSGDGKLVTGDGATALETAMAVAIQGDGKLVTAGTYIPQGGGNLTRFLVMRFDGGATGTQSQSIDFAALPDRLLGDSPFDVSAVASSTLPVRFTASGVCTILNATVTLTGLGTCSITASQDGDAVYAPAPDVTRAFEVLGARTLTVSRAGTGTGRVTSAPLGVDCGLDCVGTYQDGAVVALAAQPDAGSFFAGWSGNADCSDGQVTMNTDVSCVATFTAQRFIAERVADIRPGGNTSNSAPNDMVVFKGALYFRANDGTHGSELWRLDAGATAPVMVADMVPGVGDFSPTRPVVAGDYLYFGAYVSGTDFELFRYSGTGVPELAADINPGPVGSSISELTAFGDEVVFGAIKGIDDEELFAFGPQGLKTLTSNNECPECGSNPYGLTVYRDRLYFGAADANDGFELHVYEGGATASLALTNGLSPGGFTGVGDYLLYVAGSSFTQLRSFNVNTGADVEIPLPITTIFGAAPQALTPLNGVVYFTVDDGSSGRDLWLTDGTVNGTRFVADLFDGPQGFNPFRLIPFNSELVFTAADATYGYELRASNFITSRLIADLTPGPGNSGFSAFVEMSSFLFFQSDGATGKLHPWVTDGTSTNTEVIRRSDGQLINPIGDSVDDDRFTPFNGALYFAGNDGATGFELWRINLGSGDPNGPPVAVATAPATVQADATCNASVLLNGAGSTDPDGDALTYAWTLNGTPIGSGVSPTVSLPVGTHTLQLMVTDPSGASDSATVTVTVTNSVSLTYLGPALLQQFGPNIVQISVAGPQGPVAGANVSITVNGAVFAAISDASGVASVDVGFVLASSATIQVDYAGAPCGPATTTVTRPVNRWPSAVAVATSPNYIGAGCTPAQVGLTGSASSDADGDALSYLWTENGQTLSTLPDPTLPFTGGTHSVSLTVSDGRGGSSTSTIPVLVRGQPSQIQYTGPTQFVTGVATPVSATLTTNAGAPIVGATVRFALDFGAQTGITDANGIATASATAAPAGDHVVRVSFDGDACHEAVGVNVQATVIPPTATIVVTTLVTNDNDGTLQPADFSNTVLATSPNPATFAGSAQGVSVTVSAGNYLIVQAAREGYVTTPSAGCSGTIAIGETKNCTISNDDRQTTLTLNKQVTNNDGGTLPPSAWTLLANNVPFTQGQVTPVTPGQYTLSETGPGGYTASAWNCVPGAMNGSTVTIAPGTEVSCTIANDDQPAALTLTKLVQNDNGGTRSASDWQLTAGALLFVSDVPQVIPAGSYLLGESGPGGYAPSAWSCTGSGSLVGSTLTLAPGQSASCAITNDDIPAGNAAFTRLTPGTGRAGPITLTATLRSSATGQPLVGRTVLFTLGSQTTAAPTDFDGVAKAPLILAQAPGQLTLTAAFAGDATYAATQATRSFEVVVDTDGDGLPDSWETNGLDLTGDGTIDLPLPAMGANPLRKDVFVEVDWMVKPDACVWLVCWSNGGVLRPQRAVLDSVVARFAAAPVSNPDGSTGISLHVDGGPDTVMNPLTGELWGALSRAGVVPFDASLGAVTSDGQYDWSEFDALKQAFLEPGRRPVFHYAIYADTLAQDYYGGLSRDFLAADFVLAAGDSSWNGGMTAAQEAGVFIHELGHNLGLRHGGGDNFNFKPNYFSSMNYLWALTGLSPDSRPDYSLGVEPSIDEQAAGDANGDGRLTTLVDFNDWANLVYTGGGIGGLDAEPEQLATPIDPLDPVEMRAQGNYASDGDALLHFRGPSLLVLNSGVQSLTVDVTNISDVDTDYTLSAESALVPGGVSGGASVPAGGVFQVSLPVDTTGLVPGEYDVTFTLRSDTGAVIHRQPARVVVVDLSIPENLAAAQAALEELATLPPGSGLDPSVLNQVNNMVQSAVNAAPIANNQSVSTLTGTPKAITLTATDADLDSLTYVVVSPPAHGSLTGTAPALTYTPAPGYTGPDSFTFKANDGKADSNIATIDITVTAVNTAPIANNQSVSTLAGTQKVITLTATDADLDPLTYLVVSPPAHGSLTGTAPALTYTPAPGYTGPDSFTFKANDGKADSNIATIDITVTPLIADVVVFLSDAPDPVTIGQPLTYTVRLRNDGPDPAVNPQVTFSLPSGVSYTPAAPCTGTTVLTCTPGTLALGEERSFSVTVTPLATGQIAATASVTDTDNNDSNDSASVTTTVDKAASSTVLESAPASSTFGGSVTLTAAVTGYGTPTGTVTFLVDGGSLGSSPLANGVATLTTSSLATGTRSLTATYSGDSSNENGSSAPVAHVVQPVVSTTALSSSLNPSLAGQQVTFTATVSGGVPTGTVTFTIDGAPQTPVALGSNGIATLQTSALTEGSHTVAASYSGDVNHTSSASNDVTQVVQRIATTTTLTAGPNPSTAGQPVTFTATVSGGTPTGLVTFQVTGGAQLGQANVVNGVASLTATALEAGAPTVTATYAGDAVHLPSTSGAVSLQVDKAATTVTLIAQPNPAAPGATVDLIATVTGSSPTGAVTFIEGNQVLGTANINPTTRTATLQIAQAKKGSRQLSASYAGDANNLASTSPRVRLTTK